MGQGAQQIEPQFDKVKRGGEKYTEEYRRANKRHKILEERRKGKQFAEEDGEIIPKHSPTYRKYDGWEY